MKHKSNDPMRDPWDSQENEKCNFCFCCFLPWSFYQKWKYNFRGMQNKKLYWVSWNISEAINENSTTTSAFNYLDDFSIKMNKQRKFCIVEILQISTSCEARILTCAILKRFANFGGEARRNQRYIIVWIEVDQMVRIRRHILPSRV